MTGSQVPDDRMNWEAVAAIVRRMRESRDLGELAATLAEAAARFAPRTAVLLLSGNVLRLSAAAGFAAAPPAVEIGLAAAPALAEAVESGGSVVAMHTPTELSVALAQALPAGRGARVVAAPLAGRIRTHGILYAEGGRAAEAAAPLEALAAVAGLAADALVRELSARPDLVSLAPPPPASEPGGEEALKLEESARRFARVKVAAILERHSQAVKEGRAAGDLYRRLRAEIDAARAEYKARFIDGAGCRIDYFHDELVRTLAGEDTALLGPDYPGPLA